MDGEMQKMEIGGGTDASSSGYHPYKDGAETKATAVNFGNSNIGGNDVSENKQVTWQRVCCGIIYAVIGIFLAMVTLLPNAMMSDSGSNGAVAAANLGMLASLSFAVGGILAGIFNQCKWLLVGLVLQICALLMFAFVP